MAEKHKTAQNNNSDQRHEEATADTQSTETQILSKNQMKKLLKRQRYMEMRPLKRKEEKKRRAERKRQLRELVEQGLVTPLYEEGSKRTKPMSHVDAFPLRIVIDLSFDHLMNEKDILKLIKQIQRCYSANRRAVHPLQLYLTSFGGQCKQILESKKQNYQNWDVHLTAESYSNTFEREKLVYLTAESPNVLSELDMSKVYVIGGLVDHNSQKGLCHRLAVDQGIDHAQLPIDQFVKLNTRKVLTVNHVFEIIIYFMECHDWQDAFFKVIPPRKGITMKIQSEAKPAEDVTTDTHLEGPPVSTAFCHKGDESGYVIEKETIDSFESNDSEDETDRKEQFAVMSKNLTKIQIETASLQGDKIDYSCHKPNLPSENLVQDDSSQS